MIDLREDSDVRNEAIEKGIAGLPLMAEIYPIGGAAERLAHRDEKTGNELPAVPFSFLGRSLLEGLIRDLQGREYLYEKRFRKKIETPIVLMTSKVKDNHDITLDLLREKNWFGRSPSNFFFS